MTQPNTTKGGPAADPLDTLATEADNLAAPPLGDGVTDADVAARAEAEAEAEGMRQIEESAIGLVLMLLKLGRRALARQLPEVEETLPDEKLAEPARAFLPLLKKHLGKVMDAASKNPELAVALVGVLPIAMGIMEAMDLADKRAAAAKKKAASAPPAPLPDVPAA